MEGQLVQLDFLAVFDRVSHHALLYKLRSIGVGGQFLSIVPEFLSDRGQSVRLNGKVSASLGVGSGVPQDCVLGPLLFILYTSELFRVVENLIIDYANDTTIYAVILRSLSRL